MPSRRICTIRSTWASVMTRGGASRMMSRTLFGISSKIWSGPRFPAQLQGRQFPTSANASVADPECWLRTLCAFNPLRSAILLTGGEKTGDDRWYEKFVPIADRLFQQPLLEIKKEGNV